MSTSCNRSTVSNIFPQRSLILRFKMSTATETTFKIQNAGLLSVSCNPATPIDVYNTVKIFIFEYVRTIYIYCIFMFTDSGILL